MLFMHYGVACKQAHVWGYNTSDAGARFSGEASRNCGELHLKSKFYLFGIVCMLNLEWQMK